MFTKFTVCFIPQIANLKFHVLDRFQKKKYAESFIKTDIEYSKNFTSKKGLGYGKTTIQADNDGNKNWILPSYGEWKIMTLTDPMDPEMVDHNNR